MTRVIKQKRHKSIQSISDIRWHLVYADNTEGSDTILDDVVEVVYQFGKAQGFFKHAE